MFCGDVDKEGGEAWTANEIIHVIHVQHFLVKTAILTLKEWGNLKKALHVSFKVQHRN